MGWRDQVKVRVHCRIQKKRLNITRKKIGTGFLSEGGIKRNILYICLLSELNVDQATELLHFKLIEVYNKTCNIKTKTLSRKYQQKNLGLVVQQRLL